MPTRLARIAANIVDKYQVPGFDYWNVGHNHRDGPQVLWLWDGSLHVQPLPIGMTRAHDDFWENHDNRYHGRYDPGKGIVSLKAPDRLRFHAVPESLQQALEAAFPAATEIQTFG